MLTTGRERQKRDCFSKEANRMACLLSIQKTCIRHKTENPSSILSERAVRQAVRQGILPSINAGVKQLICYETFEKFLRGEMK